MYSHVLHSVIGVDVVQISFHFHPENLSNSVTKKYFLIKFSDHFNDFFSFFFWMNNLGTSAFRKGSELCKTDGRYAFLITP